MKKVDILGKKRVYDGFFKLDETHLRYERFNGKMSSTVVRLSLERGDSAAAILFERSTRKIILVNQFKYPTHAKGPGWIVEVVAGAIDENEKPEETIKREILEETGYTALHVEVISTFYVTPGGSSERIFLYYVEVDEAYRHSHGGGVDTEDEDIEVLGVTPEDLFEKLDLGQVHDAKTIIAVMWLRGRLEGGI